MIDLDEFWDGARVRWIESCAAKRLPPWKPETIPKHWRMRLAAHCLPAQIMAETADDGARMFQLHPRPEIASSKSWVWLLRVMCGWRAQLFRDFQGTKGHSFYQEYADKADADIGYQARMESLCGDDVYDIIALSLDFSKCYGRVNGAAAVIGYPQWPEFEPERPVRLFRSVRGWWNAGCAGAALIGDEAECDAWLRGCEGGIVTDDLAHGKEIQKRLMRPYTGPKVLVAA
jgi:hypothetical protein